MRRERNAKLSLGVGGVRPRAGSSGRELRLPHPRALQRLRVVETGVLGEHDVESVCWRATGHVRVVGTVQSSNRTGNDRDEKNNLKKNRERDANRYRGWGQVRFAPYGPLELAQVLGAIARKRHLPHSSPTRLAGACIFSCENRIRRHANGRSRRVRLERGLN